MSRVRRWSLAPSSLRFVTRDPSRPAAKTLAGLGLTPVVGDLDDVEPRKRRRRLLDARALALRLVAVALLQHVVVGRQEVVGLDVAHRLLNVLPNAACVSDSLSDGRTWLRTAERTRYLIVFRLSCLV